MPENVYNTTIMFWLQNSLIFLLRWKRSLSFSHFVDHNEILMFAKFYRSDCILEYLNFQNFLGKHAPGPPSFLFLRHSLLALSRRYYTYSQLCPSKEKFPASPLLFWLLFHPARKECLRPQGEKQFPWCQYFSFNQDSASYVFVELRCVGISGALADSDNEQVFLKLEGVINIVITTTIKVKIMIFENSCETWTRNFNHRAALFLLFKVHDTCVGPPPPFPPLFSWAKINICHFICKA